MRSREVDQRGVVLEADALVRLQRLGEAPGGVALPGAEVQHPRVRDAGQPRQHLTWRAIPRPASLASLRTSGVGSGSPGNVEGRDAR
jgi:hypothetical protein